MYIYIYIHIFVCTLYRFSDYSGQLKDQKKRMDGTKFQHDNTNVTSVKSTVHYPARNGMSVGATGVINKKPHTPQQAAAEHFKVRNIFEIK